MRRRCSLTMSGRKRRARSLCSYGQNNVEIEIIMLADVVMLLSKYILYAQLTLYSYTIITSKIVFFLQRQQALK